jgi:hypothetical protein
MQKEPERKKWAPDPEKYADAWKRVYDDIVNSRRFYYAQLFGNDKGQRYKPHTAERDYFMTWGKLPEHVIADNCQVCDRRQAEQVMEWVTNHTRRYCEQMTEEGKEFVAKREKRMQKQREMVEATDEYKTTKDERERLMKFADEWIERIRSEMSDIRGDATTKGQQGDAPDQQGAKEADCKEADTNAAEE